MDFIVEFTTKRKTKDIHTTEIQDFKSFVQLVNTLDQY